MAPGSEGISEYLEMLKKYETEQSVQDRVYCKDCSRRENGGTRAAYCMSPNPARGMKFKNTMVYTTSILTAITTFFLVGTIANAFLDTPIAILVGTTMGLLVISLLL